MAGFKRKGEHIYWKLTIPIQLALEVELLLANHTTGKQTYGAKSQLVSDLLADYLHKLKAQSQKEASNV